MKCSAVHKLFSLNFFHGYFFSESLFAQSVMWSLSRGNRGSVSWDQSQFSNYSNCWNLVVVQKIHQHHHFRRYPLNIMGHLSSFTCHIFELIHKNDWILFHCQASLTIIWNQLISPLFSSLLFLLSSIFLMLVPEQEKKIVCPFPIKEGQRKKGYDRMTRGFPPFMNGFIL